jgi:hypothetical protein
MRTIIFTISFFLYSPTFGQTKLDLSLVDSAHIQIYNHTSKEMVTQESDAGWVLLAQKSLAMKYINLFKKILIDPTNFTEDRAPLAHDNVQLYFFIKGELVLDFHLSTLTRNMFIEDGKVHRTWGITAKAEKLIKKILKKLGLYKSIQKDMRFPKRD